MTAILTAALAWLVLAQQASNPCSIATWTADLASEAGERASLRMEGRVYLPDGRTPAPGVIMYVYQTGADGRYGSDGRGGPRLKAWIKTDTLGRYRYDTILPAPYPGRTTPAHIHVQFWGPGISTQYSEDLYFEHDSLVSAGMRSRSRQAGPFANVARLEEGGPGLKGRQDFRLKAQPDRFEESIRHGVERCR